MAGDRNFADLAAGVPADFTRLSALELMSIGDRERVHTALLSWLLGKDSPLPPMSRGRVAAALAGAGRGGAVVTAFVDCQVPFGPRCRHTPHAMNQRSARAGASTMRRVRIMAASAGTAFDVSDVGGKCPL
jgi:hypothetical protein